jgi:hypothetical protein
MKLKLSALYEQRGRTKLRIGNPDTTSRYYIHTLFRNWFSEQIEVQYDIYIIHNQTLHHSAL